MAIGVLVSGALYPGLFSSRSLPQNRCLFYPSQRVNYSSFGNALAISADIFKTAGANYCRIFSIGAWRL
jgi:hypothetical protein